MAEKPILFSGAMVRAVIKGSKTQTRRVAKLACELADKHQRVHVWRDNTGRYSLSRNAMYTPPIPPEPWKVCLQKRSQNIYSGMKARAKKIHMTIPFTLAEFREWLLDRFAPNGAGRCGYSGEMILAENFSVDHIVPVSRGGSFGFENIAICSEKHNLRKGNMTAIEYENFASEVQLYAPEVQAAIWRKLEVGDVQRFSHFRRLKKRAGR